MPGRSHPQMMGVSSAIPTQNNGALRPQHSSSPAPSTSPNGGSYGGSSDLLGMLGGKSAAPSGGYSSQATLSTLLDRTLHANTSSSLTPPPPSPSPKLDSSSGGIS